MKTGHCGCESGSGHATVLVLGVEKSPSTKVHWVTDPPFFLNIRQTVCEMVFVNFEVEKMRMFLVQSIVHWCWVLVRSWGAVVSFPV